MKQQTISIDGVKTVMHCDGDEASAEAVLLLHGNPGPSDDWFDVLPAIGAFARVVAPDMPGFGRADRPKAFDYTVEGYGDFLGKLIDQLGIEKVHLVLHDFGGPWGMAWAMNHPERLASLSLVNMGVLPGYRWHSLARIWRTPIAGELFQLVSTRAVLRQAVNRNNPRPLPEAFFDRIAGYADWAQKRAVLKLYRATPDLSGFSETVTTKLASSRIPCNVIWGDSDVYIPISYAEAQREAFAVAAIHTLKGCGHWPMVDDPEAFRAALLPFLKDQTQRTTP